MRTEVAKPNPSTERPGTATLILTKSSAPAPEVMNADDNGSSAEGGTKPTADPEHLAPAPAPKLMTIDEPTSPVASRSPQVTLPKDLISFVLRAMAELTSNIASNGSAPTDVWETGGRDTKKETPLPDSTRGGKRI